MTNEEAQQLIAEINEQDGYSVVDKDGSRSTIDIAIVEKIITRFANKPPEEGYILKIGGAFECGTISLIAGSNGNKHCNIWIDTKGVPKFRLPADIEELKQLRDNVDKMLQWLEQN